MKRLSLLLTCSLLAAGAACELGPRSGRGLRLPDGDPARGEIAFRDLGCTECHEVAGSPAYGPADREIVVELGGPVARVETYGELVTSIIHPSEEISRRHPREQVAEGDTSRMRNFNDRMTVAQLVDLVAFLQSRYEIQFDPVYIQ